MRTSSGSPVRFLDDLDSTGQSPRRTAALVASVSAGLQLRLRVPFSVLVLVQWYNPLASSHPILIFKKGACRDCALRRGFVSAWIKGHL